VEADLIVEFAVIEVVARLLKGGFAGISFVDVT